MKKIAILGSTGSIGTQTLDVISKKEDLEVVGISAGSNIEMLEAQIRRFHPLLAAVGDEKKAQELKKYGASIYVAGTTALFKENVESFSDNIRKLRSVI